MSFANIVKRFRDTLTDIEQTKSMDPTIKDFESAVAELDAIVKTLEEGDLALEKSLELYERGVQLARFCHAKLEGAERRIELLNERGEIKAAPSCARPRRRAGRDEVTTASTAELRTWLDARRRDVDAALDRWLPSPPGAPLAVCEAMRYSVMAGGKRLRPLLVLAAAEAVAERTGAGAAASLALPAACAVELIHTYSLVHDDLPAMDNDTLRRGRPTAHVVYGEGMAILSGDGLLTEAFALLAREPAESSLVDADELARRKLQTLAVIAEAAGAAGMVGGQAIDLQAAGAGAAPLDAEALRGMHARKTGALIRGSALAGAIMAGATPAERPRSTSTARRSASRFRSSTTSSTSRARPRTSGKTAGKDAAAGKPTYPSLFGLDESRRLAAECADRARAALTDARLGGQLPAIVGWVIARTS